VWNVLEMWTMAGPGEAVDYMECVFETMDATPPRVLVSK
jgi:hypothetical protein